ncbi:ATP-binding protein [Streptomyces mangrovisoli]|uniref:ATP-binding protein n=1 Tax=Streptomyces mangrovisoli TaxID=1428628 RepID=A0A1J4NL64_9ACTN|nr:ATP-binding protein [Streptomyces mangrovisoli]OIJ63035.1 ATP-binding protein [Streptomyces mangrovisoli]
MSTTRPYPPGDRGPEPSGASGVPAGAAGLPPEGAPVAEASLAATEASPVVAEASPVVPDGGQGAAGGTGAVIEGDRGAPEGAQPTAEAAQAAMEGSQMRRRLSLAGESGVVPLARDFTRQALHAWGWLPAATADRRAAAEDVLLVVSELVTNACLHAEGPDELRLTCDKKVIRVEVSDHGSGQPAPRTPHRAGRPGGHGMFIVQRLCLDWGVVRTSEAPGKTVWADLGAPA